MKTDFEIAPGGTGVSEWADHSFNVQRGCLNNCSYCYGAEMALRYKTIANRDEWRDEVLTKNANITSYPKKQGVVMFPTVSDITPHNLEAYIRVAKLILAKGNRLLIVSKPRLECINALLDDLAPWKEQIMFRFTIGSMNSATCSFWEPGAPEPQERLACLQNAFEQGWRTSVSIEPMLAGVESTLRVVAAVRDYVTDSVWIGLMNQIRRRVDMTDPSNVSAVANIEKLQSDDQVLRLVAMHDGDPLIRWKDSIQTVITKNLGLGEAA